MEGGEGLRRRELQSSFDILSGMWVGEEVCKKMSEKKFRRRDRVYVAVLVAVAATLSCASAYSVATENAVGVLEDARDVFVSTLDSAATSDVLVTVYPGSNYTASYYGAISGVTDGVPVVIYVALHEATSRPAAKSIFAGIFGPDAPRAVVDTDDFFEGGGGGGIYGVTGRFVASVYVAVDPETPPETFLSLMEAYAETFVDFVGTRDVNCLLATVSPMVAGAAAVALYVAVVVTGKKPGDE